MQLTLSSVQGLQIRCLTSTLIDCTCAISSPNPMLGHFLESSRWDDSNKWSNIGFGEEIGIIEIKICTLSGAQIKEIKICTLCGAHVTEQAVHDDTTLVKCVRTGIITADQFCHKLLMSLKLFLKAPGSSGNSLNERIKGGINSGCQLRVAPGRWGLDHTWICS